MNWLTNSLQSLWDFSSSVFNWFNGLFGNKEATICLLGIENAGKSTLLHLLKYGTLKASFPTQKPTMEVVQLNKLTLKAYDMGGHASGRLLWSQYFPILDAIVFVVDAADPSRFELASECLNVILQSPEIVDVPILVLGNKIDNQTAVNEEQLRRILGLQMTSGKNAGK